MTITRQVYVGDYPSDTQPQPLPALHKWYVQQDKHNLCKSQNPLSLSIANLANQPN